MTRALGIALGLALIACFVLAGSRAALRESLDTALVNQGLLEAANAGQNATIAALQESKKAAADAALSSAKEQDQLKMKMSSLGRRLQEALNHEPELTLDALLPADAAYALCLQWHAASGRVAPGHSGNPAGSTDARTANSATAGCGAWQRMTLRDAVEWNSLLLEQAGNERLDKKGLREWAARVKAR